MPKQTYYNLDSERRYEIDMACIREFESKPMSEISAGSICKSLDLSRAAFYKYFKSVEECYFYYLDSANFDSHMCIFQCLIEGENLIDSLKKIPDIVSKALFESKLIGILKSFYTNRNAVLEEGWRRYKEENSKECKINIPEVEFAGTSITDMDMFKSLIKTISSVSHEIIRECFVKDWSREKFEEEYHRRLNFIINGIRIS